MALMAQSSSQLSFITSSAYLCPRHCRRRRRACLRHSGDGRGLLFARRGRVWTHTTMAVLSGNSQMPFRACHCTSRWSKGPSQLPSSCGAYAILVPLRGTNVAYVQQGQGTLALPNGPHESAPQNVTDPPRFNLAYLGTRVFTSCSLRAYADAFGSTQGFLLLALHVATITGRNDVQLPKVTRRYVRGTSTF